MRVRRLITILGLVCGFALAGCGPRSSATAGPGASAASLGVSPTTVVEPVRISPQRSQLPSLPDDSTLQGLASAVPSSARSLVGFGPDSYWIDARQPSAAYPAYAVAGDRLVGIFVANVGLLDRATYEDQHVDLEELLRKRLGPDAYQSLVAHQAEMEQLNRQRGG